MLSVTIIINIARQCTGGMRNNIIIAFLLMILLANVRTLECSAASEASRAPHNNQRRRKPVSND